MAKKHKSFNLFPPGINDVILESLPITLSFAIHSKTYFIYNSSCAIRVLQLLIALITSALLDL
jgi:hypothetical protein